MCQGKELPSTVVGSSGALFDHWGDALDLQESLGIWTPLLMSNPPPLNKYSGLPTMLAVVVVGIRQKQPHSQLHTTPAGKGASTCFLQLLISNGPIPPSAVLL